jgi:hypothetical protein
MALSSLSQKAINEMRDIWASVDAIRGAVAGDPFPENGFTIAQYAARYGISYDKAKYQVRILGENKKIKRHRCQLPNALGKMNLINVYTIVK